MVKALPPPRPVRNSAACWTALSRENLRRGNRLVRLALVATTRAKSKRATPRPFGCFKLAADDLTTLANCAVASFTPFDENGAVG